MARGHLREEEIESRWEAAPAVALVIAFQLVLALVSRAKDWKLSGLPWWVWLLCVVPEAALLIPLAWQRPRHRLEQLGKRRMVALALDYFFAPDVDDVWAAELIAFDDQVGQEDTALVESVQRGVAAGLVERGRLLPESERLIASFQAKVTASLT